MKLLDVNVLLHAHNPDFPQHERARQWVQELFTSGELVCLAWVTILAFLRIATNPRAFPRPLSVSEAVDMISGWLERDRVSILCPGEQHWTILARLLVESQAPGNLATDAHLAALAIEHGATICTNDRDFSRFPGLKTLNPLEA